MKGRSPSRVNRKVDEDLVTKVQTDYEPIFLLNHLTFGVRLRLFNAHSYEALLKLHKVTETSEQFRFAALSLFREEINCYEDLGALLLSIKARFEDGEPVIKVLMTFDTEKAVLHKLTAQSGPQNIPSHFHLHDLITKEYLPVRYQEHLKKIIERIANIIKSGFATSSAGERHDAYIRIKHGPVCFSTARIFRSHDGGQLFDLPGALIKPTRLKQEKRRRLDAKFLSFPFLPLCMRTDWEQTNKALLAIDVCTRLQQLLIICFLQKFHKSYLKDKNISQKDLIDSGLELDMLLEQLPDSNWSGPAGQE